MKKLILPILALALVLGSCTDNLTSLNEDPKAASDVPAKTLFSSAQVSLGTFLNSTNVNRNIFKLISQYWAQTVYTTESQYVLTSRSIPSNIWSELYRDVLKDLDKAATKIENDKLLSSGVKKNQLAQIEILKVLTYYELVNIFGNIPYSEALDPQNTQPKFDDQEAVYMDLLSRLNTAIGNLNASSEGFGSSDVFYNGDISKWIKFANSLKMRMGITLSEVKPSVAQSTVEAASPNAFQSNADNAIIPFQTGTHQNPLWEALVQSGRNDYVPANTIVDMMNNLDDPRRPIHFQKYKGAYVGGTYGAESNTYSEHSHFGEKIKTEDFEGIIMEYAEVEFIRAEAAVRGWNVSGTAKSHYDKAVRADMEYWGVSDSEISDYLSPTTGPAAFPATGTNQEQMEAIAQQKWMGLYLQGIQGWTEWRRLDHPTLNAPPISDLTYQDIPTRFTYPVDEQNLNQQNYEQAASAIGGDTKTTLLFWDVAQDTKP